MIRFIFKFKIQFFNRACGLACVCLASTFLITFSSFDSVSAAQSSQAVKKTPAPSAIDELDAYLFPASEVENKDDKAYKVSDKITSSSAGLSSRKGARTEGVLVIKRGEVIYEKYARGYDQNKKHIMWSVSKTIMSLLYGVALKEGRIQLDQSICEYARFENTHFCYIKIKDVLTWSTAIQWKEEYEGAVKPTQSSILAMLYGQGRHDMASFVKNQPLEVNSKPGEIWRYSSGDSVLAAHLLQNIYKGEDLREVYKNKIFNPLQIQDWTWEADNVGTLAGAYYFYTSVQGLARIGELLLGKGTFKGKKIFDESYWDFMTTVPESYKRNRADHNSRDISGAHLWLNKSSEAGVKKAWPAAPEDTVACLGHWGQYLVVIPSEKMIVVRIGDTRDRSIHLAGILEKLMAVPAMAGSK